MDKLDITQWYETTVAERGTGRQFRFVGFPKRAVAPGDMADVLASASEVVDRLELQNLGRVAVSQLPQVIVALLQAEEANVSENLATVTAFSQLLQPSVAEAGIMAFAEQLAYSDLIPFEQSPLSLVSLVGQIASASKSSATLGAVVGLLAATGHPILLVTIPAGILICGGAMAVAKLMEERRDQIAQLAGLPPLKGSKRALAQSGKMARDEHEFESATNAEDTLAAMEQRLGLAPTAEHAAALELHRETISGKLAGLEDVQVADAVDE